ncbi:MAG TPA: response regulator [Methanospirillum sp.]|nr:response regulator [Methanospirillum sp.]
MNAHDLKIGTQLALGLGCILIFVILLGFVAYIQEERLWQETKGLYDHPLQVRRAIGELNTDILTMHQGMKDLILTENETETQQIIQDIDRAEANSYQKVDILYDRYLGPRSDIDKVYTDLVQWRSIRDETIRLLREGNKQEAADRVKKTGISGAKLSQLIADTTIVSDFAVQRGDQFYQSAETEKNDLILQLEILICVIILLSLCISYFLLKGLRDPVRELTVVTEQYRMGRLDVRSRYESENELGLLSVSFNNLAETIQTEIQIREKVARISEIMLSEDEITSFCRELLAELIQHTNSQIGAIYRLNIEKTDFLLLDSIGLSASAHPSFSAITQEGEFGLALVTGLVQHITEIPDDTRFILSTVSGDIRPREIITIPILTGKEVIAVISISSVSPYSGEAIRLVNDIQRILTARFNGVLAYTKNRELSQTLESQNRELSAQSHELISQTRALKDQNTELDIQKQQLAEANRLKSVFLSNMSHELRTPLNSVIALSGVLSRRLQGSIPDDEHSYLEIIERNGRLLLSLINDILDIARIEAGREDLQINTFSIEELIHTVIEMVEPQAQEKNIGLESRIETGIQGITTITSDQSKCQHILLNLVSNAVKFTEKGTITISVTMIDDVLQITVTDTGIGIAEDMIPYIFDEFRQADERIGRTYGGSGLGLAIAKKYTNLLGGTITVQSTPGTGSTFTLRLPLNFSQELVDPPIKTTDTAQQGMPSTMKNVSGRGETILLVDDNEPAIIQITDLLKEQGYQIRIARDGKDALKQIQHSVPDAMILDLMMPEVDGFTVLHTLRRQEKTALIPVLILTAKHITQDELKFLTGNHIHQLIQKGDISRSGLLAAVKNMVYQNKENAETAPTNTIPLTAPPIPTILVIEDNPDNMTTMRALLSERSILIEASDGQSGIEEVRAHRPDIILLDLSLPGLDGFAVLDALRKEESLNNIPIIALTARAMKGDREEILERGFDGYLSKPVDEDLLRRTIQRVLYGQ